MAKYRKKPVVVDAVKFQHGLGLEDGYRVVESDGRRGGLYDVNKDEYNPEIHMIHYAFIKTLEGNMSIGEDDWIITGVQGERYPIKPDIFEATYETVEDEIPQGRWDGAIENARFMLEEYKKIPTGAFGAINIANSIGRYDNGERTKELLHELEDIN